LRIPVAPNSHGNDGCGMSVPSPACLQSGAVRLFLALMLGLLFVPGYVVTPVLFAEAGSRVLAGHLAGQLFHIANGAILVMAFLIALPFYLLRTSHCVFASRL